MAKTTHTQHRQRSASSFQDVAFAQPGSQSLDRHSKSQAQPQEERADEMELQGLYIISVASRMLEMHPQTLRKYERLGLVRPSRTVGMLRLYSQEDIERIRLIRHLQEDLGLNLAGVEVALRVLASLMEVRRASLEAEADSLRDYVSQQLEDVCRLLNGLEDLASDSATPNDE